MRILLLAFTAILAGMGTGPETVFAGKRAAAVINPMHITFLDIKPYFHRSFAEERHAFD